MQLILASQSPRRKELMGLFHIPFSVQVADIDETMDPGKAPFDEVARVSRARSSWRSNQFSFLPLSRTLRQVLPSLIMGKSEFVLSVSLVGPK